MIYLLIFAAVAVLFVTLTSTKTTRAAPKTKEEQEFIDESKRDNKYPPPPPPSSEPLESRLHIMDDIPSTKVKLQILDYYYYHTKGIKNSQGGIIYEPQALRIHKDTYMIEELTLEQWEGAMLVADQMGLFEDDTIEYELVWIDPYVDYNGTVRGK